jgi:hypothetical protein
VDDRVPPAGLRPVKRVVGECDEALGRYAQIVVARTRLMLGDAVRYGHRQRFGDLG